MPGTIQSKDAQKHFRGLAHRLRRQSLAGVLRRIKRIGENAILDNFRNSRRSTGAKWRKRKRNYPWPILIKTGDLMRSATQEGAKGHVERVGARYAYSGTAIFYGAFHQYGTARMVARPFEELPDSAVDMMAEELADELLKIFNA